MKKIILILTAMALFIFPILPKSKLSAEVYEYVVKSTNYTFYNEKGPNIDSPTSILQLQDITFHYYFDISSTTYYFTKISYVEFNNNAVQYHEHNFYYSFVETENLYADYIGLYFKLNSSTYEHTLYLNFYAGNSIVKSFEIDTIDLRYINASYAKIFTAYTSFTYEYMTVDQSNYDKGYSNGYKEGLSNGNNNGFQTGYDEGFNDGYSNGYIDGEFDGFQNGKVEGQQQGYEQGLETGFNQGYDDGYLDGYEYGLGSDIGFDDLMGSVFNGFTTILSFEILPNITIGSIVSVPLVFGVLFFILGKRKGD